jgi:hypothetical protein
MRFGPWSKERSMIMKLFVVVAVVAAIAAPLSAQSTALKVNVPFEFAIGSKILPAGEYRVMRADSSVPHILRIRSLEANNDVLVTAVAVGHWGGTPAGTARLVFNRYGNQYFLSQVWDGHSRTGEQLPTARTEHELARTASAGRIEIVAKLMPR